MVEQSEADKITVCFADERRVLVQAKARATGALQRPAAFDYSNTAGTKPIRRP